MDASPPPPPLSPDAATGRPSPHATGERLVRRGYWLAVVLVVAVAVASVLGILRLRADFAWVARTHEVSARLERVMALATDAETAGRGYAITGDDAYLAPYATASTKVIAELARLEELVADPAQDQATRALAALVDRRLALIRELVDLRRLEGFEAARRFVESGAGKAVHDALRADVQAMRAREEVLLRERQAATDESTALALAGVVFGSLVAVAIASLGLFLVRRDYIGSRRSQALLTQSNQQLDARVAERTAALQQANEQLELAGAVFNNAQEYIVVTDPGCRVVAVNPAFTRVTEYAADEVVGRHMRFMQSGRHDRSFYQQMWQSILAGGEWQGEMWNRRKSGDIYQEWLAISTVRAPSGKPRYYIGIGTDLSRIHRTETALERLAHYDALTGLPNRLLLSSRLAHTLERAGRDGVLCAVMFLDLDRFKAVNDTLGHAAGDELLKLAAERIRERLRDVDTLARLGGDEFVVVLEAVPSAQAVAKVAQAIVDRLTAPFVLGGGHAASIGTSIGIAFYPGDADTPADLLARADKALYAAKAAGRNTWRFARDLAD